MENIDDKYPEMIGHGYTVTEIGLFTTVINEYESRPHSAIEIIKGFNNIRLLRFIFFVEMFYESSDSDVYNDLASCWNLCKILSKTK